MLTIRLQPTGKRNHREYRVVLADQASAVQKRFVELLGNYNPHNKALVIKKPERLQYWVSQHVHLSPTVQNLLITNKMLDDKKVHAFTIPKKPVVPVAEAAKVEAVTEAVVEASASPEAATESEPAPETPVA